MKRLIIVIAMGVFEATLSPALTARTLTIEDEIQMELINTMAAQSEIMKNQISETKKIHESITGFRMNNIAIRDGDDILLSGPKYIYDKKEQSKVSPDFSNFFKNVETQEQNYFEIMDFDTARKLIDQRIQYAAIIDKFISLRSFEETEKRFMRVVQYLMEVKNTEDLKSVNELQVHIKGVLAMIQNEATKLQMVTHLRNAEQALIRQQKYNRNIQILSHKNVKMPIVQIQYKRH
ncbi:type IV secretion system protein VirB5 [Bartonella silvatica]|uniref:Type IV secretion system protein VirB5 n=1 Tax=Bartonella silvatica TaxID=357760 RepID=A0ABV2HF65_9HYPH